MSRDKIRAALLTRKLTFKSIFKEVEFQGEKVQYEIRQPTVAVRDQILKAAQSKVDGEVTVNPTKLKIEAALLCTFEPNTDVLIFERANVDEMLGLPTGDLIDQIGDEVLEMLNGAPKEIPNVSGVTKDVKASTP